MYEAFIELLESIYYEGFAQLCATEHPDQFTEMYNQFLDEHGNNRNTNRRK